MVLPLTHGLRPLQHLNSKSESHSPEVGRMLLLSSGNPQGDSLGEGPGWRKGGTLGSHRESSCWALEHSCPCPN